MPALDVVGLFNMVETHAMTSGLFDTVSGHEAKSAPGHGMHYEVWCGPIDPIRAGGLDYTSARVIINGRIKCNMTREPQDLIETDLLYAVDRLMASYVGDFQLSLAGVRKVDLLGAYGSALRAVPGYLNQNSILFRVADVTIPIICNDVWEQVA